MKNYLLAMILSSAAAHAGQLDGKAVDLSASASLKIAKWKTDDGSENDVHNYGVDVRPAFLFSNGMLGVGPIVGYEAIKVESLNIGTLKLGVFAEGNFLVNDNIYLGPGLDLSYTNLNLSGNAFSGWGIFPYAGAKFFVSDRADINLKVGYNYEKVSRSGSEIKMYGIDAKLGLGIVL